MRRMLLLGALISSFAAAIVINEWVRDQTGPLLTARGVWIEWIGPCLTIAVAAVLAYLLLRWSRPDLAVSAVFVCAGAVIGFAAPVAFTLGQSIPELLDPAVQSPGLVIWQSLSTCAVGICGVVRSLQARQRLSHAAAPDETNPKGPARDTRGNRRSVEGSQINH